MDKQPSIPSPSPAPPPPIMVTRSQCRDNDVLFSRGHGVMRHPGNRFYHQLITKYQHSYRNHKQDTGSIVPRRSYEKRLVARNIVSIIESLDPPGRFLKFVGRQQQQQQQQQQDPPADHDQQEEPPPPASGEDGTLHSDRALKSSEISNNTPADAGEEIYHVIQDIETKLRKISQALRDKPRSTIYSNQHHAASSSEATRTLQHSSLLEKEDQEELEDEGRATRSVGQKQEHIKKKRKTSIDHDNNGKAVSIIRMYISFFQ